MNTPVTASSETKPPPNLIDQRIGKYRVVRKLGEGGMGSVFEAVHVEIGQRAAVKLLKPELSSEPKHVQRFFDEAKLLSMVNHPGLIKIYDFDRTADGQVYIVMELLEGETLWSRFEKQQGGKPGGMPVEDVARMVRQVAAALAAVHQRGIIHRDGKPTLVPSRNENRTTWGKRREKRADGPASTVRSQSLHCSF
ncbi:MAG: serine/threonine protein kinase [Myxococcales bacterium]|nr:serine/threonine protein kinase [Myxococcales bacterium]